MRFDRKRFWKSLQILGLILQIVLLISDWLRRIQLLVISFRINISIVFCCKSLSLRTIELFSLLKLIRSRINQRSESSLMRYIIIFRFLLFVRRIHSWISRLRINRLLIKICSSNTNRRHNLIVLPNASVVSGRPNIEPAQCIYC